MDDSPAPVFVPCEMRSAERKHETQWHKTSPTTGTEVSNTAFLDTLGDEERERIAALVADNFASQIITDGFYHADPHSGNVLIKAPVPRASADEAQESQGDGKDGQKLPEHGIE